MVLGLYLCLGSPHGPSSSLPVHDPLRPSSARLTFSEGHMKQVSHTLLADRDSFKLHRMEEGI